METHIGLIQVTAHTFGGGSGDILGIGVESAKTVLQPSNESSPLSPLLIILSNMAGRPASVWSIVLKSEELTSQVVQCARRAGMAPQACVVAARLLAKESSKQGSQRLQLEALKNNAGYVSRRIEGTHEREADRLQRRESAGA